MTALLDRLRLRLPASGRYAERLVTLSESARYFARLFGLAWRAAPGLVLLVGVVHLSLAAVPVVQVWVYKLLVDGIAHAATPGFDRRGLWLAAAIYVVTLLFSQTASTLLGPLDDRLGERLQGSMRLMLIEVARRQAGLAFYEDEAVQNDLEAARRGADYSLLEALWALPETAQKLVVVATLSLLLARLHPLLPLLLVATAVPRFRFEAEMQRYIWTGLTARSSHWRWLNYCARVLFSAEFAKEVRLFGLGDFFLNLYRQTFERAHDELIKIRRREQRGTTLFALIHAAVTGGAYVAIVLAAARGRLTVGDVALYTGATFQLSGALDLLARYQGGLSGHKVRLQAFFNVLDRPPALGDAPERDAPVCPGARSRVSCVTESPVPTHDARRAGAQGFDQVPELELRDVWFRYPKSAAPALRGINLRIAPGETLAIVGENGAGKTTLLNLIARLYDPTAGEILADGIPLQAMDVREWRHRLSNVSQEFLRLEAPLRTNLALGSLPRLEEDEALGAACEQVGLAEVVRALPGGLDQMLGRRFQGGVELSGGEWQKVAIARALLREEAGVILLDEPTSALDAPTEHAIFRQFVQLAEHRTTLLVSHRFSTVPMADRILVLEAGAILEEGTHTALVARGGKYAELFDLQAARYR